MVILIVGIQIKQHRLPVSHMLPSPTLLIVLWLLQPSVPVSGMHINCGNEGHPEEQLESSSVSPTDFVGKMLPGGKLTGPQKNTIWSWPTTSHLYRQAAQTESVTDHISMEVYVCFGDKLVLTKNCFRYRIFSCVSVCWPWLQIWGCKC